MKYLSEWDQWKRYSSKSWKRFIGKAREMTTYLELWRKDIRSIEGTIPPTLHVLLCGRLLYLGESTALFSLPSR